MTHGNQPLSLPSHAPLGQIMNLRVCTCLLQASHLAHGSRKCSMRSFLPDDFLALRARLKQESLHVLCSLYM